MENKGIRGCHMLGTIVVIIILAALGIGLFKIAKATGSALSKGGNAFRASLRGDGTSRIGLKPLIIMAVSIGALISVGGLGHRGFYFLPSFVLTSGFVLGVGLLIKYLVEQPQT
jgi:hypothetical protein